MSTIAIKKTFTEVPARRHVSRSTTIARALAAAPLSPLYLSLAKFHGQPGTRFATASARLGIRALFGKTDGIRAGEIYPMIFWPVESTRYFEFEFAWRFLEDFPIGRILDVSSPRLFPMALLKQRPGATAELINPDEKDLKFSAELLKATGLANRANVSSCLLEDAPFAPGSFDAVTSLSVVEHIRDDSAAVKRMWELLKPGGRLVLSVPCMAEAEEQYLNVDPFGLQHSGDSYFLQYVYDQPLLEEKFCRVLGRPAESVIYGEKRRGSLREGLVRKWSGASYPEWREPYTMWQEFQRYESLADLPGEGVIVMRFDRP